MGISRRSMLAGLGAAAAMPAWAQAIGSQSDPWAQVDPYADPRNGFPAQARPGAGVAGGRGDGVFAPSPAMAMAEQDEIELGRAMYPKMVRDFGGAYPDSRLQEALRQFCRPLFAVADRASLPWEVTLVRDRSVNAAAFAGGKVVVNVGLLPVCDTGGELAAVLGHEIGHVDLYHSVRAQPVGALFQTLRQQGAGADMDAALRQLVPGGQVRDVWQLFDLAFSREDESEADAHAMEILDRLGVDPLHAVRGQESFTRMSANGHAPDELASTHPPDPDRLARMRSLAATMRRPAQDFVFPGWDALKAAFPTKPEFKKT